MDNLIASRISGGNSEYRRNESDFYPTPYEVTQALINFLGLSKSDIVWEPACGEGHMVEVFNKNGIPCIGTDIITGTDFFKADLIPCNWIITNPPFNVSEGFIRRCIEHDKPFALLLKTQYWNAKKRFSLFKESKPSYILPLTWRPDFLFKTRGKGSPLMDIMWVVWRTNDIEITRFEPLEKPSII